LKELTKAVETSKAGYTVEMRMQENHRIPWMVGGGGGEDTGIEKRERDSESRNAEKEKEKEIAEKR
jgi:hypothetical protein